MMQSIRYMLANWIAGGELEREQKRWEMSCGREFQLADANARALELIERMEGVIAGLQNDVIVKQNTVDMWEYRWNELDEAWTQRVKVLCWAIQNQAAQIDRLSVTPVGKLHNALQQIIASDTPGGNGTVKRMVRIAREGLK